MPYKVNISSKEGKSWKIELESEIFVGKKLGEIINGAEISSELAGYELEIKGASDIAGFPHKIDAEGPQLRKILLSKGWGMHDNRKGVRLRKSVRGNVLSEKTVQINLIVIKEGSKKLSEIFPEQNKAPEPVKEDKEEPSKDKENEEQTPTEIKEENKE